MATKKLNKKDQALLDLATATFAPFKTQLATVGKQWLALKKQDTELRFTLGSLVTSMLVALKDKAYPEAERPDAVMARLKEEGVHGFTFSAVEGWAKGSHAWNVIPKTTRETILKNGGGLYTFIDLSRIPTSKDDKTGGMVAVAKTLAASDATTDDEHRDVIRAIKQKASGKTPAAKVMPTVEEMAQAIADAASYPVPVLVPNVDGTFTVSLETLVDVATMGYAWRETGGGGDRRTQAAYRRAFEAGLGSPLAAPEADGSGAEDANAAEDSLDEARALRAAAEASLAETDASLS